uniref:BTB domain-containing protein n=1 Tax=Biomphalaria glabrata TaxID=6526 RepID=A0A2C9KGY9_BIOGL
MVIKREVAYGIVQGLSDFWKCSELQDFTVTIGKTQYGCHRLLLAACSGFFRGLFRSGMKETELRCATVEDISNKTFELILETLYTGRGVLTNDNVIDIWRAAHQLQITFLIQDIEEFIIKTLSFENYVDYFVNSRLLNSETVSQTVWSFILKNSNDFFRTNCFNELPLSDVLNVIRSQDLVAESEDDVINAILRWVEFTSVKDHGGTNQNVQNKTEKIDETNTLKAVVNNHDDKCSDTCNNMAVNIQHEKEDELFTSNGNRRKYLLTLLSSARLGLTSHSCLHMLARRPLVHANPKTKDLIMDVLFYQLQAENKRSGQWPSWAIHRNSSPFVNVAVAACHFGTSVHVSVFSFSTNFWLRLFPLESKAKVRFAVRGQTLYALGTSLTVGTLKSSENDLLTEIANSHEPVSLSSTRHTRSLSRLHRTGFGFGLLADDPKANSGMPLTVYEYQDGFWLDLTISLTLSSERFSVVVADSFLYILSSDKQFWRLDPITRVHVQLAKFPNDQPACHVTNYEHKILVFSSVSGKGVDETVVHCYHMLQNIWTRLNNLEGPAKGMTSFKDDHFTYILQSSGDLWRMVEPQSDLLEFEHVVKLWSCDWPVHGAVTFIDELYIYGVKSEARKEDSHLRKCIPGVFRQIIYMESNDLTKTSTFLPFVVKSSYLRHFS